MANKFTMGRVALCMAAVLMTAASPAHALFGDDEARKAILDLRERTETTQNAQMQLATQLDALREQNAKLVGRIEKLTNELAKQQRSTRDLFGNLDKRIAVTESSTDTVDGKTFPIVHDEKRRYDLALQLFADKKYGMSERLFITLIDSYPTSGYVPAAYYWVGLARYINNDPEGCIEAQDYLISNFEKDPKVPEAMLSKAAALASINGKKREAADTYKLVMSSFKDTEYANIASTRLKALGPVTAGKSSKPRR